MTERPGALVFARLGTLASVISLGWFGYFYVVPLGRLTEGRPEASAIAWNAGVFLVFAAHHSVFARSAIKRRVMRIVPYQYERALYVWIASLMLAGVILLWKPVSGVWFAHTGLATIPHGVLLGLGVVAGLSAFRGLDVADLTGVRQALSGPAAHGSGAHRSRRTGASLLRRDGFYALVRHPLYLSIVCLVFGFPVMTWARLEAALLCTAYVAAAIPFEERTLREEFGAEYDAYARDVRWRLLPFVY